MTWWAIDVRVAADERPALGAWLVAATGQAIEEQADGTLVTFAESEAAADALMRDVRTQAGPSAEIGRRALEEVDWTTRWRDGIAPRRFGRLVVRPSWIDVPDEPGTVTVMLDPETAFGSGEHGSTRAALALLERHMPAQARVLDLGSGSGILAIAAMKLGAASAVGIEMDAEANPVAERNAARNAVTRGIEFLEGEAGSLAPLCGPADLICSNILRTVNVEILPAIARAAAPDGVAIFSGMEVAEEPAFRSVLERSGWTMVDEAIDAGWWACVARPG